MNKIVHVETLLPKYCYDNDRIIDYVKNWVKDQDESLQKKALKIFKSSNILKRHSILEIDKVFSKKDLSESMEIYKKNAIELSTEILRSALAKKNWKAAEIDCIITTSCTGFMIPSFDSYVIDNLGLRDDVIRLPVTEIGCTAGAASLIYANEFLKNSNLKKVAVINLEFPGNTIQLDDFSMENIVGSAIFADGVSAYLLTNDETVKGIEIVDTQMIQIPKTTELLNYNLTNGGFSMKLDKYLPNMIAENIKSLVTPFLKRNNLSIRKLGKILIHPGGQKILKMMDGVLTVFGHNLKESRYVMETYGNLSSATLGFILENYIENKKTEAKDEILMIGFGPGFSAHQLLLRWDDYDSIR